MDMNLNSVYQKCDICKKRHKEIDDVYEWYCHYLDYNPKNVDVEIWDSENKVWIKRNEFVQSE